MALFGKVLEPVGYMQTLRGLVQNICSYLDGSGTPEDLDLAKKNMDHIDQELSGGGRGLLKDEEVHQLEGDLAVVYGQLGALVRANPIYTKRETEAFLQCARELRLERQLIAIHARLMGVSALTAQPTLLEELIQNFRPKRWEMREFCEKVNFVLGTGLLCLFVQASLTGRDQALLMKTWGDRMGALYRKMKSTGALCSGYFLEQAREDVRRMAGDAQLITKPPEEQAAAILKALEKNYDWLRWAVMVHPPSAAEEEEGGARGSAKKQDNLLSVPPELPAGAEVVACYRDTPTSLDKSRIHQLIVELEWKIPNPPPEVFASLEEEPERAGLYLAGRMLRKLQEGLGTGVAVHVVPGPMDMRCNFPQASFYLYEYKHRLASGTVCVFG
ncbi:hypothetical protein SKAU_G00345250 [Synaphobranchus kaupii]|uniref:Uncharacterized protein n=1 Tax=Synaphobranchus kaupii TaxID=118154 RepID=A0A9Q1EJF2_SYNKA|nr:hypothetical protein SKAU_G00345250 [Synaphobranchus kaupii]